jgi:hypothetical protein
MSNRDDFNNGFLLGSLIGGIVGGIIGAVVANKANQSESELEEGLEPNRKVDPTRRKAKRPLRGSDSLEMARRSLDDKIVDLDRAIDAVRSSLGSVPDPNSVKDANQIADLNDRE